MSEIMTCWSKANSAFNARQRLEYNRWRSMLRDEVNMLCDYVRIVTPESEGFDPEQRELLIRAVRDRISECPIMIK